MDELRGLHLNGIKAVEAVLRCGSLRDAADELGVTPGAISQHINKTEAQLGCRLFERRATGLVATSMGEKIKDHLSDGFRSIARGIALARARPLDAITISVAPVFAGKWLVWRLHRFTQAHPDVRVRIDASVELVDPNTREADACIRLGLGDWPTVQAELLFEHRVFPVCSPDVAQSLRTPQDLARVPVIRDTHAMFSWNIWLAPNDMDEAQLGPGPEFSDAALCLDAAIAGQGVFLAWETLAQDAVAMGRLVAPFPGRFRTGISYWFVEPAGTRRPPQVDAFRSWLTSELAAARL